MQKTIFVKSKNCADNLLFFQLVNTIIIPSFYWYDTTCHRSVVSKGERQVYTMNSVRTGVLLNKQYTKNKRIVM